jgi:class 3 adenylate cyclase/CHASE2 domain-containing sensor protein
MITRRQRVTRQALGAGLLATVIVLWAYRMGALDWLELKTLDLRFAHANRVAERPEIACIDIDDGSLQRVGRWPWPRDVQAGVLAMLAELGAKAILYDVTLGEPEPLRSIIPEQVDLVGETLPSDVIETAVALPDDELRTTLAATHVFLAFDYADNLGSNPDPVKRLRSAAFRTLVSEARGPHHGPQFVPSSSSATPTITAANALDVAAEWFVQLEPNPLQSADALPQWSATWEPSSLREPLLVSSRELALEAWIRRWLGAAPGRWQAPVHDLVSGLETDLIAPAGAQGPPHRAEALAALRTVLSYEATTRGDAFRADRVVDWPVDEIAPVYFKHARAARRCGFVVFRPDSDGVMRRMRLFIEHDGRVLPQLAVALAHDATGWNPVALRSTLGVHFQVFERGGVQHELQVDADGCVVVPWLAQGDFTRQFGTHIPADALWQVNDRRQSRDYNEELILAGLGRALAAGDLAEHAQFADDLRQKLKLEEELRLARYRDDTAAVDQTTKWLADYQPLVAEGAAHLHAALRDEPNAPTEHKQLLHALTANADYQAEIDHLVAALQPRVAGKLCLVGYTATSLADMTPIPTCPRAPGVIAHANLLNGLLIGRTVRWAPAWLNLLAALIGGGLTTFLTAWRPPRTAGLWMLLAVAAYVGLAGWLAFYVWLCWIALTPVLIAIAGSYSTVLLYRYVFLERESLHIARALGQYTSATLARQMAEEPDLCRRAETRIVSTMFTDLAGFTSLSERIGAELTQHVLNVTLGCLSDVLLQYEAMINKFIGDGIFAFWNPVIYPQADHARRACQSAIDLQTALTTLRDRHTAANEAVFGELHLRIGVATGHAVVGPCGSEQKYDYTCIGDSVNVASRLESANKFYGTRILVSEDTRAAGGDGLVFRPLGGVQVKGKTQAVPIHELLGRAGDVPTDLTEYAEQFGAAVNAFQARDWTAAVRLFEACAARRADDLAARQYVHATRQFQSLPPPADWNGSLELTEK